MPSKTVQITPLNDRVLVRPDKPVSMTKTGLHIPSMAAKTPTRGVVISAGRGRIENGSVQPMQVSQGDQIIYAQYAGTEIEVDGDTQVILSENDILAKVR